MHSNPNTNHGGQTLTLTLQVVVDADLAVVLDARAVPAAILATRIKDALVRVRVRETAWTVYEHCVLFTTNSLVFFKKKL